MSSRIPQPFIDELLERTDVVEVVDSRVKLKRAGKNYSACCPFHEEKTPSFTVSPDKQFYYCFGCGASGNAVGFVMEFDRCDFRSAVELLAKQAGLQMPTENSAIANAEKARAPLYDTLAEANDFYQAQLRKHPQRLQAVNYLRARGLDGRIAKAFAMGFAPPGWDNLIKQLFATKGEKAQEILLKRLQDTGLAIARPEKGTHYDRFRHRIMFPIIDIRGRTIGFGGRVLGDDKPKYLNSPETAVFQKGKELYGLYQAIQHQRSLPKLLVVEGYMDVVALAQFDIHYAVATLGTACGEDHLNLAFKYTSEVVFCFDGDAAGKTAAKRALENALPVMTDGRQVKFLFLPDGEDPDSLVRQVGKPTLEKLIDHAVPLEDFFFDTLSDDLNPQSIEGRARISQRASPLLAQLPSGIYRELMFDQLARRTGVDRSTLDDLIPAAAQAKPLDAPVSRYSDSRYSQQQTGLASDMEPASVVKQTVNPKNEINSGTLPPNSTLMDEAPREEVLRSTAPLDSDFSSGHIPSNHTSRVDSTESNKSVSVLAKRLCSLLLIHTGLAKLECDFDRLPSPQTGYLSIFFELYQLLQQRPHYSLNRILGHWRAAQGHDAAEHLAQLAAGDVLGELQERITYDAEGEFFSCLQQLYALHQKALQTQHLQQLLQRNLNELSAEEKKELVQSLLKMKHVQKPS